MSEFRKRVRLDLNRLADRVVPSTVNATTTVRPFDFVATGTLTTTTLGTSGLVAITSTANTAVTLNGQLDYTNNQTGAAGLVTISGTGTGNEVHTNPTDIGGRGSFAQTVQGQLSIADDNGVVTTPTPLTGTVNWLTPTAASGIDLIGPQAATGAFDVANFKLQAGWSTPGISSGNISVTLAPKVSATTDLAFGDKTAAIALDGSFTLDFTANVTGNLLHAPSHDTAATTITAIWEGNGKSETADVNVPIFWNAGAVVVHVEGLTPPAWATKLTVKLDASNAVAEADETNNAWTVSMSDLIPPPPPPPPAPPPVAASFVLIPGVVPLVQWRSASGAVIAQAPAFDGFGGPATIATGDVNGDGVPDVAIAAGDGGGPRIRVMNGRTGALFVDFFAYDPDFRGGSNIALGDLNGDGKAELITGAGVGGGPHVRVFNPVTGELEREFFAYDPEARGGVHVAAGDLNGDHASEIITTPGAGEGGFLFVFDGTGTEKFRATVTAPESTGGTAVSAALDPLTNSVVVVVTPDDGGPLLRFRSQILVGDPLLVPIPNDPILLLPVAT